MKGRWIGGLGEVRDQRTAALKDQRTRGLKGQKDKKNQEVLDDHEDYEDRRDQREQSSSFENMFLIPFCSHACVMHLAVSKPLFFETIQSRSNSETRPVFCPSAPEGPVVAAWVF